MNQQTIRDTVYKVTHRTISFDTSVTTGSVVDSAVEVVTVVEVPKIEMPIVEKPQLTAFDSIQPCNISLVTSVKAEPLTFVDVRTNQKNEPMPMNLDIPINGIVLAFTMAITVQYLVTSQGAWKSLFDNIRKEMA
jgi:hypothetical protein